MYFTIRNKLSGRKSWRYAFVSNWHKPSESGRAFDLFKLASPIEISHFLTLSMETREREDAVGNREKERNWIFWFLTLHFSFYHKNLNKVGKYLRYKYNVFLWSSIITSRNNLPLLTQSDSLLNDHYLLTSFAYLLYYIIVLWKSKACSIFRATIKLYT